MNKNEYIFQQVMNNKTKEKNIFEGNRLVAKEFVLENGDVIRLTREEYLEYLDWCRGIFTKSC